jgi:hypothetical protein
MKIRALAIVTCLVAVVVGAALWKDAPWTVEVKKDRSGSRPWSELCAETNCERFPRGHISYVMTNGDTLYTKPLTWRGRCCGLGRPFHNPETETGVVLDAVKVEFYEDDFREMGVTKYDWPGQAEMFFASSEKILYRSGRESTLSGMLNGPRDLSLDPNGMELITAVPDFLYFHQSESRKSVFSVISRDPILFGHRVSVNCGNNCNMLSFDFEEGPGTVGLHVRRTFDFHTIPGFLVNCGKTQTIQTCPAFSKNVEVYRDFIKDISALYAFLKIHPNERVSHVRN